MVRGNCQPFEKRYVRKVDPSEKISITWFLPHFRQNGSSNYQKVTFYPGKNILQDLQYLQCKILALFLQETCTNLALKMSLFLQEFCKAILQEMCTNFASILQIKNLALKMSLFLQEPWKPCKIFFPANPWVCFCQM